MVPFFYKKLTNSCYYIAQRIYVLREINENPDQ